MSPAIVVAVWVHRCRSDRMRFLYRLAFVIPMVIPGLVVALIWRTFFFEPNYGFLNHVLVESGLHGVLVSLNGWLVAAQGLDPAKWLIFVQDRPSAWLGDPRLILTACVVWGFPWVGSFAVLTHLARLQNIPKDLYEAAEIDGASWWSKFTRIEIPMLMSSIHLMLVFVIIGTIKDAGTIFALAGIDGAGGAADVPALFMLRKAFVNQDMGAACAVGIVLTLVVIALQKLGDGALAWDRLSGVQRVALRGVFVALAAGMMLVDFMTPVAVLILWFAVARPFLAARRAKRLAARAASGLPAPAREPFVPREPRPPHAFWSPFRDRALRFSKHAGIVATLLFALLPVYLMLVVSLKSNAQFYADPTTPSAPYHWEHWSQAWRIIMPSVANSIFVCTSSTAMTLFLGLGAAYFFGRARLPLSGLFWNAILLLMMMPTIANLIPLFRLLRELDMLNSLTALIAVGVSGGQILAIFVLRSFVMEIPGDLFEAAEVDGASHFQQMLVVVVPLCGPILGTVGVMHFMNEWNEFILPLIVMRDSEQLPVMVQLLRMAGEYVKFWGPLMAGYSLASVPVIFLFACTMKLFVRGMTEGAVKG
jgi:ABC-type glycerol-3-phosphate transport system permease component